MIMAQHLVSRARRGFQVRVRRPLFRGWKHLRQRIRPWRGQRTRAFVAGAQRSGTNMLMHVLERSPDTEVFHEVDPRAFDQYMMRDTAVIQELAAGSPARCFVIKALCEADRIPGFLDTFDNARCVWLYRHYHDVANSMLVSFRSIPDTVHRLATEGQAAGWWGSGMSERTQSLLAELVQRPLSDHSLAALLWYVRNVLFFEHGLDEDERVVLLQYEAFVSHPESEAKRVCEFLDVPYSDRFTARVNATSVRRREPPPLDDEVDRICSELLQRFESVAAARRKAA